MKEKQVYLFEKDGSYKVVNVDRGMNMIGHYSHDHINNPCWQTDGDYIRYREPVKDWLEVKTLAKVVSIDSYSLDKGLVEGANLVKDNLKYGQCVGSYEKAMGFGRDFKLELNYALVKDSPLYTIITELEKSSKNSSDKDIEHQKEINTLVDKIKKLEKENDTLLDKSVSWKEYSITCRGEIIKLSKQQEATKELLDNPNITFLYLIFINWVKGLFKRSR